MEEKNCELTRLGQRLKMNEEHNARLANKKTNKQTKQCQVINVVYH